ncbi:hypothetical protein, partial (mitochondrion) [Candida pseudojiufengensis]
SLNASNIFNLYFNIYILYFIINSSYNISKNIYYSIRNKYTKQSLDIDTTVPSLDEEGRSIIYGSLLGNSIVNKCINTDKSRITFYQESSHNNYLLYLYNLINNKGYCNNNIPKILTKLSKHGKIIKYIRFNTLWNNQFNTIYDKWYLSSNTKVIPKDMNIYLTPLAIAIWTMGQGIKHNKGLLLPINSFRYNDLLYLTNILYNKYNILCIIESNGKVNQYNIYILPEYIPNLYLLIKSYIIPSMKYKYI